MKFTDIIGQNHIKKHLMYSADHGRIPHAQLFISKPGSGALPMAIAYAQYLLCKNSDEQNESGNRACNIKCEKLNHPDLHFSFPFVQSSSIKSSDEILDKFKEMFLNNPYAGYNEWLQALEVKNQQPIISVKEGEQIAKKLSLKSFEGGYKIMIIWMVEKMNTEAANKLLKLLEEPPQKTIFLLITENEEQILQTIRSRCQTIHFNALSEVDIAQNLIEKHKVEPSQAHIIAKFSNGNFTKALESIVEKEENKLFDQWFVQWVRAAFLANRNPQIISKLIQWSETISDIGRENQKMFLQHCLEIFRQAFLFNYGVRDLIYYKSKEESFHLEKFAPFIHPNNIHDIYNEINDTIYHVERNGNAKILLSDLSIKLTKLIHRK